MQCLAFPLSVQEGILYFARAATVRGHVSICILDHSTQYTILRLDLHSQTRNSLIKDFGAWYIFGTKVRGQFFMAIAKKPAKTATQRAVAFGSLTGDPQSHGVPFSPFWPLK